MLLAQQNNSNNSSIFKYIMLPHAFYPHPYPTFLYYSHPHYTSNLPTPPFNNQQYILIPFNAQTLPAHSLLQAPSLSPPVLPQGEQSNKPEDGKSRQKRDKNAQRERISARKNSQSNIINHYFSYYGAKQGSYASAAKIAASLNFNDRSQKLVGCLYSAIRAINMKRGKNYINKSILNGFFTVEGLTQSFPEFIQKLHTSEMCSVEQLSQMLRKSFYLFLRDACFCCILTSKRISLLSKQAHLEKQRKMLKYWKIKESFD